MYKEIQLYAKDERSLRCVDNDGDEISPVSKHYRRSQFNRDFIAEPFITILVGTTTESTESKAFQLPEFLLREYSSYFKAALDGGFREAKERTITLDDEDPDVFRTFAAWLFE